ncbi:protein of unknown function [Blastococcus mobilis]|uniref:DUF4349 domain-containing protein n=1 Tax=Blastococcus mobilis TaxID=1938746 RepID=A0A238WYW2_9ACTN|nr:protein of unknown function [Blastococcus mobilis]
MLRDAGIRYATNGLIGLVFAATGPVAVILDDPGHGPRGVGAHAAVLAPGGGRLPPHRRPGAGARPDGFLDGLGTGWRALVSALGAAVVVLGILLPWAAVAVLVAGGVLVPVRLARRRAAVVTPAPPVPPQG